MQIRFNKEVDEVKLIQEFVEAFPVLKGEQGGVKGFTIYKPKDAQGEHERVIEVNDEALTKEAFLEIIRAHEKGEAPPALTPAAPVLREAEALETQQLLRYAASIPGAHDVIKAVLEVMSFVQEVVQGQGESILKQIAPLETKLTSFVDQLKAVEKELADVDSAQKKSEEAAKKERETFTAQSQKRIDNLHAEIKAQGEKQRKRIDALELKLVGVSAIWDSFKDSMQKIGEEEEEEEKKKKEEEESKGKEGAAT